MKLLKWLWNPQHKPIITNDDWDGYVPKLTLDQVNEMFRSIGSDYTVGEYDPMCADVLIPIFDAIRTLQEKVNMLESKP